MNSADNREELARACGKYLLATRMATVAEIKQEVLAQPGRYTKITENLHAKEVVIGDGERRRRYILCFNPKEAERQRAHRDGIVRLLEEELASHRDRHASAQWAVELLASKRYKRYLTEAKRYDGKWVLETNDVVLVKSHENDVSCFATGYFYKRAVADFGFLRCHQ
jgi:hypothetical protein